MSDMTMRLQLTEDVSSKMKKIVSEAKNVSKTMKTIGEAVDEAFDTSIADDFSDAIGKAADETASDFSKIGDAINDQTNDVAKSLDQASDKFKKALDGFKVDGDNNLAGIGDNADNASRSLSGLNSNADTLGSTLKRLFTIAAGAVALDKLKDFGLSTLEESAAASAREAQFSQVFAGVEGSATYSLGQIANNTGIQENRLKESYTSIAAFAKTTGMETADAMDLSNRAMKAVADSAAFYDRSLEEVTESLQSYLKGNYENDAALGLSSTEYTRNAEAMELYGKKFQDLTEEQKQWTLLSMVEEANELSGALGQASREADTWTNQTGNLAQAWEDMKASLGDNIMDQSIGAVKSLTENMDEIEEPLSRIFGVVGDVMEDIVPMIPSGLDVMASGLEIIGSALGKAYEIVSENPQAIGTALTAIASGMIAMKAANSATKIAGMISGSGGLTGALSSLSSSIFGSPWAAGAAVIAAAVAGIAVAVDQYNDLQIDNSLAEHFGTIELSQPEIEDMASRIIDVDWLANVNLALGEFENADTFHNEAEEALNANKSLEWQAKVQTTLSNAGSDPVSPFISGIQESLDGRQDSSGLEYLANVPTTLEPDSDVGALANELVEFANLAVSGAESEELQEYAQTVAVQIDPDGDQATLASSLVDWANGVISGAKAEELQDYTDNITVDLTPEESDTFYSALTAVVNGMTETELETPPHWEDTLEIVLTPEMQADYISNINTYLDNKAEELNSLTFGAVTSMETVLGDNAGQALLNQVQSWAAQDTADMSTLSNSMTALVQEALEDGVLQVEEQAAIEILQNKINNIVSGWKEAQAEAEWQTLEMKWSGSDLTPESFTSLLEEAREQRETAIESLDADTTAMNAVFNGWLNSGKIDQSQRDQLGNLWNLNYRNTEGEAIGRELSFASNSLNDTYGDLITENLQRIQDIGGGATLNSLNNAAESGNWNNIFSSGALTGSRDFYSEHGGKEWGALNEIYQSMEPDVTAMQSLIDNYAEEGSQIPQAIMDAYNQAIEIGAAAGDSDAAWQHYANSILESGNEQLIDAISNQDNPMYEAIRSNMAPELADAIDRAFYAAENTTASDDLSEMFNAILGLDDPNAEIDVEKLSALCEKFGLDISDYLSEHGIDVDAGDTKMNLEDFDPASAAELAGLTATGETITLPGGQIAVEYEVEAGQTLSEIAANAGVALDELIAANPDISNPNVISIGQKIYVPQSSVEVDASEVGAAVEEQTQESVGNLVTEATAETTITDSNTDASGAYSAANDDLDDTFSEPMDTNGYAGIEIQKQSDNISEVYSQTSAELQNAFNTTIPVTAKASITVDYSIANPTKTITFSGDATGSGTVYAHAAGGIFEEPHYGLVAEAGPEAIIPLDGSDNAISLWQEAGERLGAFGDTSGELQGSAFAPPEEASMRTEYVRNDSRNINITINGNGVISADAGMTREDVANYIMDNIRDIILDIVADEDLGEGDGTYDW